MRNFPNIYRRLRLRCRESKNVANWLSGYYNGKRGNTVIEVGSMQKNVHDLERYCRKNHEMPVMDAAKNALGAEK